MPRTAAHLYLIGYRGSGKSTVARLLAGLLQRPWVDSDDEIQRVAERSITEIFRDQGEAAFRDLETAAIDSISRLPPRVVALGGGAILRPANRQTIQASGTAIWLDARPEVLYRRIVGDRASSESRPSLTGQPAEQEVRQLMQQRRPLYEQASTWRIDVSDLHARQVAAEIATWFDNDANTQPNRQA